MAQHHRNRPEAVPYKVYVPWVETLSSSAMWVWMSSSDGRSSSMSRGKLSSSSMILVHRRRHVRCPCRCIRSWGRCRVLCSLQSLLKHGCGRRVVWWLLGRVLIPEVNGTSRIAYRRSSMLHERQWSVLPPFAILVHHHLVRLLKRSAHRGRRWRERCSLPKGILRRKGCLADVARRRRQLYLG